MKKVLSVALVLVLVASIAFECSVSSSAIAGVDDIVVIGVCLDLLALGVSIHSVSNFCKSQAFNDFCRDIGQHVDSGISAVKRAGKLFVATSKLAWQDITNWVKNKIHPGETQEVEFETESEPTTLMLADGTAVPYALFMEHPFLIYHARNGNYIAFDCTGNNAGVEIKMLTLQFYCTGHGTVSRYDLINGEWNNISTTTMSYGLSYMDTIGSVYNVNFGSQYVDIRPEEFWQYRTINRITDNQGTIQTAYPPAQTVPEGESTATITVTSDENVYPGAVNSPAEVIEDGETVMIEVPAEMIVEAGTVNEAITTDREVIGNVVSEMVVSDVNPRILTNSNSAGAVVDDVIANTPESVIPQEDVNNPDLDIETANKFRLPRSFLEGFPFSIPYSIYVGIQSFVAEPVAPRFDIPFAIPRLGIDENMVLDLSQFSPLARLCRALLSLVWVAGLAMACSKFIKR